MKKFCSMLLGLVLVFGLIMPASAATAQTYADIKPRNHYYDAALWAGPNSIIPGVSKTKFAPTKQCTNAKTITYLWRALGKPAASVKGTVAKSKYYRTAVAWADQNSLFTL